MTAVSKARFKLIWVTAVFLLTHAAAVSQNVNYPIAVVQSAAEIGYPPFSFSNEAGEADGFSVDLLRAVLQAMGYAVNFKVDEWSVVKHELAVGALEVLPLVGRTPEREDLFDFTFPYLTLHGTIVTHRDTRDIGSLDDLTGKTLAVMAGDNAEEFVRRTMPGMNIVTTYTFLDSLLLLSMKEVDAVIIQHLVALQLMQKYALDNLRITGPPLKEFSQAFCFAVTEGSRDLLAILNEGLALVIADGTYERLYEKWFHTMIAYQYRNERIVIGGDRDYPPYEFLDENGEPAGFNVELTKAIAEELGLSVEIVLDTWGNTYRRLLQGDIDMVQGVFYSLERDRILSFSQPYLVVSHAIVTRKGEFSQAASLEDMKDRQIIVMEHDIMHQRVVEMGYASRLILVPTQQEALKLLAAGEGDCVLAARIPALHWIGQNQWSNLEIRAEISAPEYHYAVLEGGAGENVLRQFSHALVSLKTSGLYHELYAKWFGINERSQPTFTDFIRNFAYVFIGLFAVVLVVFIWSAMLRKQVRAKTRQLRQQADELLTRIQEKEKAELQIRESEAQFRTYIEHSPIGIFICDEHGDYQDVNTAASSLTGYSREELLQLNIRDLVPPALAAAAARSFQQLLRDTSISDAIQYQRKDGSLGYWTLNAVKLSERRFLGFTTDITQLKQAEEEISSERERLAVTLRSIGDGVITTDTDGKIFLINKVAESLTGWSQQEATGRDLREVFHIINEFTGRPIPTPLEKVMQTGSVVELENHTLLISRTGERRIIADSGAPIFDSSSKIIGLVLVFRDMSEEYRVQEQLQQTAKLDSLGILAGGIAHDFNNLLSGIFGYAQLARESQKNGEECAHYIDEVLNVFNRAKDLTQQLLTFSRGGKPLRKTRNIGPLIRNSTAFALSGSNIRSLFTIPDSLWLCDVDENQIGQVIDNIVINAQQAMPMGGTVQITAENAHIRKDRVPPLPEGDYVHIAVSDTGIGIQKNLLPKVFDPFFTTKQKGTGLGLATSYSIMRKHDGAVTVSSELGKGTTLHLYLPKTSEGTPRLPDDPTTAEHSGIGIILIVDDEKIIRTILRKMLSSMGYTPIEAADGKEALKILQGLKAAAEQSLDPSKQLKGAIFDLTIPGGKGGRETVLEARKIFSDVPMFAASGYSNDAVIAEPEKYGFTGSLIKPFRLEDLSKLLSQYID